MMRLNGNLYEEKALLIIMREIKEQQTWLVVVANCKFNKFGVLLKIET